MKIWIRLSLTIWILSINQLYVELGLLGTKWTTKTRDLHTVPYLAQVIYAKKLSQHFLLHFPIGIGSYDHHAKYQGVFP